MGKYSGGFFGGWLGRIADTINNAFVRVGGAWVAVAALFVRAGGAWAGAGSVWIRKSGAWFRVIGS